MKTIKRKFDHFSEVIGLTLSLLQDLKPSILSPSSIIMEAEESKVSTRSLSLEIEPDLKGMGA